MIAQFVSYFDSLGQAKELLADLESLVAHFEADYVKDGNAKDALLDSVIEYLQSLKGKK